ncbi:MAG TPA: threonylcarbamoyl-AMP synthase [Thermoplasmatales archaeon]|nr:L-threonylcarbamoyladenylate synthase [Candidatus Thermoplasmatota archaeon]HDS58754.1 threonylcarbamoyl-AMP synthase [Thermoplasmatales archaeon]
MTELEAAVHTLQSGGLVVYPTDTLYALGASISHREAVERVYAVKRRPLRCPLPVAVAEVELMDQVGVMTAPARRLAGAFLPGPLTLVLARRDAVPAVVSPRTVAVRVPDHPVARCLLSRTGPLTATSANLHRGPLPATVEGAREQLGAGVDLYVDGGLLPGTPSTIVDATGEVQVLREGAIPAEEVYAHAR